jgi:FkbM family methyltransferase
MLKKILIFFGRLIPKKTKINIIDILKEDYLNELSAKLHNINKEFIDHLLRIDNNKNINSFKGYSFCIIGGAWSELSDTEKYIIKNGGNCFITDPLDAISDGERITVSDSIISDKDGTFDFYITSPGHCSSTLIPDYDFFNNYNFLKGVKKDEYVKLKFKKLSSIYEEKDNLIYPQYLRIDVQGAELNILKGLSEQMFDNIKLITLEASLKPYYLGQPLFSEIDKYLTGRGYLLEDLGLVRKSHIDEISPFPLYEYFPFGATNLYSDFTYSNFKKNKCNNNEIIHYILSLLIENRYSEIAEIRSVIHDDYIVAIDELIINLREIQ